MTDMSDRPAIRNDYDLAVTLALALREAHAAGDTEYERRFAATLSQAVHTVSLTVDPGRNTVARLVYSNGRPDPKLLAQLFGPYARHARPAGSLNSLIVRAQQAGQLAASLAHDAEGTSASTMGDAHHPGDDTGRLVLEAYRAFGAEELKAVLRGYQAGYNARASELGDYVVRWIEIKNGINWALPGATDEEARSIKAAL